MNVEGLEPISGVKNCHAEGLFSLVFNDDLRMFATTEWTSLAANAYGDAVGYHDHHRDLEIKVVVGEIENISPQLTVSLRDRYRGYSQWQWDSKLRGGKGQFSLAEDPDEFIAEVAYRMILTPDSAPLTLPFDEVHTINQLSRVSAWFVKESGPSMISRTSTWSRADLSDWHLRSQWYVQMSESEVKQLWTRIKGLVK